MKFKSVKGSCRYGFTSEEKYKIISIVCLSTFDQRHSNLHSIHLIYPHSYYRCQLNCKQIGLVRMAKRMTRWIFRNKKQKNNKKCTSNQTDMNTRNCKCAIFNPYSRTTIPSTRHVLNATTAERSN